MLEKVHSCILKKKLKELSDSLKPDCLENIVEEYDDYKAKLDSICDCISNGATLWSRIGWYEKGEKATIFFLNLEKQNKAKTHVQLLVDDDIEYNDPDIILNGLKLFMKICTLDVSCKTELDCMDYIKYINAPSLSADEKTICEGKLTLKEAYEALSNLPSNKTPGNDDLSREFYLAFFYLLGSEILASSNYSYQLAELSNSLIYSVGQDIII